MRRGDVSSTMEGIATAVLEKYLRKTLGGQDSSFSAPFAASQLAAAFLPALRRFFEVEEETKEAEKEKAKEAHEAVEKKYY
ncbi:hypothetical protein HYQ45_000644 [Verticillium longisporum]|uniref:Uncharacterized protein n=1 Tax=Verticillium longisporum TaxID=100787 RepID=A0A8I3AWX9_VERLO|nr:hypothetical protein HYQ45_000644 [Verticillium longisporum]